jgi:RNA polymerase sigma-70 factor (ECF subfamily)
VAGSGEADLIARLRAGDEQAFVQVVTDHQASLVRIASTFVSSRAVAEEIVQDTWLAVVRGIDRFEGRSSLRTWLISIVVNRAKSAGVRERRSAPVESPADLLATGEAFAAGGQWGTPPTPWTDEVEDRLVAKQVIGQVGAFLAELPETQRQVVLMRDVEQLPAAEVCAILGISEGNQRVQLHRGRVTLRAKLADLVVTP